MDDLRNFLPFLISLEYVVYRWETANTEPKAGRQAVSVEWHIGKLRERTQRVVCGNAAQTLDVLLFFTILSVVVPIVGHFSSMWSGCSNGVLHAYLFVLIVERCSCLRSGGLFAFCVAVSFVCLCFRSLAGSSVI